MPPPFAPSAKPALPLIPDPRPPSLDSPCCLFPSLPLIQSCLDNAFHSAQALRYGRDSGSCDSPHVLAFRIALPCPCYRAQLHPRSASDHTVLTTMRFFQALGLTRNSTRKSDTIPVKAPVAIQPPKKVGCLPLPIASTPRCRMSCPRPLAIFLPLPHHVPETQTDNVQPLMRSQPCR